ncbi:MAG: glutaredoxin [Cyanobacteria bacterium SIG31]|nr:glutaredoxin [Cyanobacteria bacterium SIG31]
MFELYVLETCPFCQKVMTFFRDNCVEYIKNDISNPIFKAELLKLGGKEQVPFLYDTDTELKLYESNDIIDYVKSTF